MQLKIKHDGASWSLYELKGSDLTIVESAERKGSANKAFRNESYKSERVGTVYLAEMIARRGRPDLSLSMSSYELDQLARVGKNQLTDDDVDFDTVANSVKIDLKLAFGDNPGVSLSDAKLARGGPSLDVVYLCVQRLRKFQYFIHGWRFGRELEASQRDDHVFDPKPGRGRWRSVEELIGMILK